MAHMKQFSAFLFALLLAGSSAAAPGDPGCQFDVDGDGLVTQQDLEACAFLIAIFPPVYNPACDANGDGILTAGDLGGILANIGLDCTAPVPFGTEPSRGLLVVALLIAGAFALRVETARRSVDENA